MNRLRALLAVALLATASLHAQHTVTLSWSASPSSTPTNPGTIQVFRSTGACPASGVPASPTSLTSAAPAAGPYVDSAVAPSTTYCYYVEAIISSAESTPSNTTQATVIAFAPASFSASGNTVTWTASPDSTTANPGTVAIFRAPGNCPATGLPASPVTLTTTAAASGSYTDSTATSGSYCYYAEAEIGGMAGKPSATASVTVNPFPPSGLNSVVD